MTNLGSVCRSCGTSLGAGSRFCSQCGKSSESETAFGALLKVPMKAKGGVLLVTASLFLGAFGIQNYITAKTGIVKPTEVYAPPANQEELPEGHPPSSKRTGAMKEESVEVKALRAQLEADPENLQKMRAFAAVLGDKLREDPFSSSELAFDAIDVLGRILQKVPNDPEALVMMADVSFDQKAFSKAVDLYKKYLEIVPGDVGARARYASTLTFLGKFDDSVRELDGILIQDPKNFPAKAYLAITYAQQGNLEKAKSIAQEALQLAPSDEARARFNAFVSSLDVTEDNPRGNIGAAPERSAQAAPFENPIVAAIRSNPIAGSKFVRAESEGDGILRLYFSDFPMQAMPPFAKEKFFSGIREKARQSGDLTFTRVVFLDQKSGTEMEAIDLKQ